MVTNRRLSWIVWAALATCSSAQVTMFVDGGRAAALGPQRGEWSLVNEAWTGRGSLVGSLELGGGDARVEAQFAGAATFIVGSSRLDLRDGEGVVAHGALFVGDDVSAAAPAFADVVSLVLSRRGDVVTVSIDGDVVALAVVPNAEALGPVGFASLDGPLALRRFAARGALVEPAPKITLWESTGATTFERPALLTTPRGSLLAACERHTGDDVDIVLRRSTDSGRTWSAMTVVSSAAPNESARYPCLVASRVTDVISLLMTHEGASGHTVWTRASDDDGATWTDTVDITAAATRPGWNAPTPIVGAGIELGNSDLEGRLVVPAMHIDARTGETAAHVLLSDGFGASWTLGGVSATTNARACKVIERDDGTLALFTVRDDDSVTRATSDDGGTSWSATPTALPIAARANHFALLRHAPSDTLVLAVANPEPRESIRITTSRDNGVSWSPPQHVAHTLGGPVALAVLPDGTIACAAQSGLVEATETIVFTRTTIEEISDT